MLVINIKELVDLKDKLKDSKEEIDRIFRQLTVEGALTLNNNIMLNTPVKTGNLRNNWQVLGTVNDVKIKDNEYSLDLVNMTDYVEYVNYGHRLRNGRWWEGIHFIEKGEEESQKVIEELIQLKLERYIKDLIG